MRLLFFFTVSFLSANLALEEPDDILSESIVLVHNKSSGYPIMWPWDIPKINVLSYGIQIDENRIILPANADEFYEDFVR